MVKVTSHAGSGLGFSFGVRARTEMEIWSIKGICMLKVVLSEKKLGFNKIMSDACLSHCMVSFRKIFKEGISRVHGR